MAGDPSPGKPTSPATSSSAGSGRACWTCRPARARPRSSTSPSSPWPRRPTVRRAVRGAALRTFLVVNRRIVVNEAAQRAWQIAARLKEALHDPRPRPAVSAIARRLAKLGGWCPDGPPPEGCTPLGVAVLRGGMFHDNPWPHSPAQPLVCTSTVDQIGSRLLFRGYGLGPSGRVLHAGLVGNDSLILLDEAHLSHPFLATAKAVARFRRPKGPAWGVHAPDLPFRVASMSTAPGDASRAFGLSAADREDETLRRRLAAVKLARLDGDVPTVAGDDAASQERLAARLADHAVALASTAVRGGTGEYTAARHRRRRQPGRDRSPGLPAPG